MVFIYIYIDYNTKETKTPRICIESHYKIDKKKQRIEEHLLSTMSQNARLHRTHGHCYTHAFSFHIQDCILQLARTR